MSGTQGLKPRQQALITGGGGGIGGALAAALAGMGIDVHLAGRSERAPAVARKIVAAGGVAAAYRGSVADESFCKDVIAAIERQAGSVDIVVNAAAVLGEVGSFVDLDMARFAETVQTNLLGTAHCMRWALPGMCARGFGRIINFAGGGAAYPYPRFSAYGASKCAIVRLTETVAQETATPDVTVNVIAPGAVATEMLAAVRQHGGEVRTVTAVEEAVKLVQFLISAEARGITGRFLHVRDRYRDVQLFEQADMLTLRRVECR